ncbi:two-component system phosphotransfer protein [Clavibacter tessellarius]|uniref:Two-component system phosphotransfer protein n=1 Tax=Clavibacter tessellarius TaxID=31965 RepID=A0A154V4M9_9MICO|nr:two-component system phosphotransfer protein [Clavibacter michiganensis subsp. tessellarius]
MAGSCHGGPPTRPTRAIEGPDDPPRPPRERHPSRAHRVPYRVRGCADGTRRRPGRSFRSARRRPGVNAHAARAPQLPPLLDVRVLEQLLVELSDVPGPARLSVVPPTDTPAASPGVPAPGDVTPQRGHPEPRRGNPSSGSPRPDDRLASRGAPAPGRGQAPAGSPRPVGAPSRALQAAEPHALPDAEHACIAFLRFYVDLWPSRWDRLAQAVADGDRDAALDACLSVKSSAAMVGALRLSAAAAQLESAIRGGRPEAARFLLAGIGETGERSMDAMRSWIRASSGAAPD